ncbi:PAS domain-containing protein [Streptomyces bambusae]|uniref:response regulator n=1 Tax=Streptomyces bambusae TaxID=1550616 RepID=UPI001CFF0684|nr:PAS domain-containing protein [Streptomyces bambusae]MCB5168912.1 PAS domain-containing protein [Streptomyces bambusae]
MSSRPSRGAARLAAILDALPDALLLVNANGTVVNANSIALEVFESPGTGLVGRGLLSLLPEFDSKLIPGSMRRPDDVPEGRTKPKRMTAHRTDGSEFPAEVTSAGLEDGREAYADAHRYTGDELLMLVVRDLSGTVDTEAELARSQRQTEMILRAAAEGVVGTDTDGRVVLVNPAAAQILGYRATELGNRELHSLVLHSRADGAPFPFDESPLADTLRSGRKHRVRGQVLWNKAGKPVSVDLTTSPVRDGEQLVGAVMTFTDRRPYDALAARHAQLLALADEALRGPLEELRGELATLAADDAGQLWPEANQLLHHLAAGYSRMTVLLDNVLSFQRLDAGTDRLTKEKALLDDVVASAVEGAVELIGPGRAQFAVHAPTIEAEVDAGRLATALAHLIADLAGVDATGKAPVTEAGGYADSTIVVALAQRGKVARIEVRGPYAGGNPVHGPIVRGIVGAHGGVLQTHEVPGMTGSAYVLEVPLGAGAGTVTRPKPEPAPEPESGPGAEAAQPKPAGRRARRGVDAFLDEEPAAPQGGALALPSGRRRAPGADLAPAPVNPAGLAAPVPADGTGRRRGRALEEGTPAGPRPAPAPAQARAAIPAIPPMPSEPPRIPQGPVPPQGAGPVPPHGAGQVAPHGAGPVPPQGAGPVPRQGAGPAAVPPPGAGPASPLGAAPVPPRGPAAPGAPAAGAVPPQGAGPVPPRAVGPVAPNGAGPVAPHGAGPVPPQGSGPVPPLGAGPVPPLGGGAVPPLGPGPVPGAGPVPPRAVGPVAPNGAGPVAPLGAGPVPPHGPGPMAPQGAGPVPPQGSGPLPPHGAGPVPVQGAAAVPPQGAGPVPPQGAGQVAPQGPGAAAPEGEQGKGRRRALAGAPEVAVAPEGEAAPGGGRRRALAAPGAAAGNPGVPGARNGAAPAADPYGSDDSGGPGAAPGGAIQVGPNASAAAQGPHGTANAPGGSGAPGTLSAAGALGTPGAPGTLLGLATPAGPAPVEPLQPVGAAGAAGADGQGRRARRVLGTPVPADDEAHAAAAAAAAGDTHTPPQPHPVPTEDEAAPTGRRRALPATPAAWPVPAARTAPEDAAAAVAVPGARQAQDTDGGSGRRRKLAEPDSGADGSSLGTGRAFAIGAPAAGSAEGPEPLDGPGGAVEVVPHRPVPQPVDDELPPEPLDNPRRLLVWPAPDVQTQQALSERGYRPVIVHSREEVDAQIAAYPAALFVDPLTGPITRTALQSLRQAAGAAEVPVLVTAGLGQATREAAYGADPAVLLKALAPRDSEQHPSRVLLLEQHDEIAQALTEAMERRGMQVARADADTDAVELASRLRPNLVVMDLMQVRRRRAGIVDWLRANGMLNRTPLVVYTSADIDKSGPTGLGSGETVLFLAERATTAEVQGRIVDLLAKIGTH